METAVILAMFGFKNERPWARESRSIQSAEDYRKKRIEEVRSQKDAT